MAGNPKWLAKVAVGECFLYDSKNMAEHLAKLKIRQDIQDSLFAIRESLQNNDAVDR